MKSMKLLHTQTSSEVSSKILNISLAKTGGAVDMLKNNYKRRPTNLEILEEKAEKLN